MRCCAPARTNREGPKLRILVINWQDRLNPHAGGAEIHLHEIFGRLARRGHEVTLLVSGWADGEPRQIVDGMETHRTGGRHTFSLAAPRYYHQHLRGREFDVVVEDLNKIPLFSPRWVRRPLALIVHHLFGRTAFEEASAPVAAATWLLERPLAREYRNVPTVAVSRSTADDLIHRGFDPKMIEVIPNGVDLDFYRPDPQEPRFDGPALLYLGRLKKYKRVDLIIRALARLRDAGVAARLIVAGQGDHGEALRGLVAELGLEDRVEFPGYVSEQEKRRYFRGAWVHVLTSPKEGWGITNLEAAACGTPTVASDSPGLRDSVVDGRTGFLVPHGDVAALAGRLAELLDDAELRERLGTQAREFAEGFGWDAAADRMEEFLQGAAKTFER